MGSTLKPRKEVGILKLQFYYVLFTGTLAALLTSEGEGAYLGAPKRMGPGTPCEMAYGAFPPDT